mmetsp:Transcript_61517/g.171973  ORF Transcript_61517/g.171973 Transcript_61517/m.171973 type:complete len:211 (-) Transcript_61517:133-765(-)
MVVLALVKVLGSEAHSGLALGPQTLQPYLAVVFVGLSVLGKLLGLAVDSIPAGPLAPMAVLALVTVLWLDYITACPLSSTAVLALVEVLVVDNITASTAAPMAVLALVELPEQARAFHTMPFAPCPRRLAVILVALGICVWSTGTRKGRPYRLQISVCQAACVRRRKRTEPLAALHVAPGVLDARSNAGARQRRSCRNRISACQAPSVQR